VKGLKEGNAFRGLRKGPGVTVPGLKKSQVPVFHGLVDRRGLVMISAGKGV